MIVRGKWVALSRHALDGMNAERPRVDEHEVQSTLEEPAGDDGQTAIRWTGSRTLIVRYEEHEDEIRVRSVSATTRRLAP